MDMNPNIVIVSCSNVEPTLIVDKLSSCVEIHKSTEVNESLYTWNIDTKYYTADVNIRTLKTDENTNHLQDTIEAVVIHFDNTKESGLQDIQKWQDFLNMHQPEIKILIADSFNLNTKVSQRKAIAWCLDNGFELIELNPPQVEDVSPEDEIIKETKGIERVIEALQTHMWSNLIMKSKVNDYHSMENAPIDPANSSNIDKMLDNLMLDDEKLEFHDLFQQLHMMKESVQTMPLRERRHCAEQVVAAFWKAIGGDDDEIGNI